MRHKFYKPHAKLPKDGELIRARCYVNDEKTDIDLLANINGGGVTWEYPNTFKKFDGRVIQWRSK